MFYSFASSILVHNTGLPLPIMLFFVILLLSLAIGWISIKFHENIVTRESFARVDGMLNFILETKGVDDKRILEKLNLIEPSRINLLQLFNNQKAQVDLSIFHDPFLFSPLQYRLSIFQLFLQSSNSKYSLFSYFLQSLAIILFLFLLTYV